MQAAIDKKLFQAMQPVKVDHPALGILWSPRMKRLDYAARHDATAAASAVPFP